MNQRMQKAANELATVLSGVTADGSLVDVRGDVCTSSDSATATYIREGALAHRKQILAALEQFGEACRYLSLQPIPFSRYLSLGTGK